MARKIVVVGSGPAAVSAAIEAKKRDSAAEVTLVTDEACEPYEKPPLSKAVLLGKANPEDAPIAGKAGVASFGVHIRHNSRCTAIDRAAHSIETATGSLPYDALVLATGSKLRELPHLMPGTARVHYLRTEAHARALRADLTQTKELVVIGAGLIGLEVAASAAELGIQVTVLDLATRVMGRTCDEETAAALVAEHQHHGVDIELGCTVTDVTRQADGHLALETSGRDMFIADMVVVGLGVTPETAPAEAAGLKVQDGILVDEQCRTSDPDIFAAGDCTRFPGGPSGMTRQENWRHAQEHGVIAGRNAAGASESYRAVPSFWSEQYDLYIQGVGWPAVEAQRVRRPLPGKSSLMFELANGRVTYALGYNVQRDMAAIRRLIERNVPVDAAALADPSQPLQALLKAKA